MHFENRRMKDDEIPPEIGEASVDPSKDLDDLSQIRQLRRAKKEVDRRIRSDVNFKLLVSSIRDYAIFLLDPEGNVLTWNEGAQRIKGYSESEVVGKHFSMFYREEEKARNHPATELAIAQQQGRYEEEGWRVRKDGSLFWANVVITALLDNGELIGFAKVTRDLTERKNAERAREAAYAQAAKANDELQHIAQVISHELQEPVSNMTRYCALLVSRYKDRLGQDADQFLDKISTGASITARLVDDLWTYARVSKTDIKKQFANTGSILQSAKDELYKEIQASGCKIIHQPYEMLPSIECNRDQLGYVFRELISNAIKHNNKPGTPELAITVIPERSGWTFCFKDNGPGIDKFFAQQVFNIYNRLNRKPDQTGTGMGLPICKKIVEEQHLGKIGFESKENQGCTFYLWLPA